MSILDTLNQLFMFKKNFSKELKLLPPIVMHQYKSLSYARYLDGSVMHGDIYHLRPAQFNIHLYISRLVHSNCLLHNYSGGCVITTPPFTFSFLPNSTNC